VPADAVRGLEIGFDRGTELAQVLGLARSGIDNLQVLSESTV
jgi:hypothetical protein